MALRLLNDRPPPLELVPAAGCVSPVCVVSLKRLGQGRAAQVQLVRATLADGREILSAEKVFRPSWLTRATYRAAFQSPFAYRFVQDAVLACYYRRRVAAALLEAAMPDVRIARALYVRWDPEQRALVLGTEFIQGRGIVPQAADPHMLRRWLDRQERATGNGSRPPEEMGELLATMACLEQQLLECGLTGSGWQVCQRTLVSTANLLRTPQGYVLIDLESGVPACLVPAYLRAALRLGRVPLFDDVDQVQLQRWIESHQGQLLTRLGPARSTALRQDVRLLIDHGERWKDAEPALWRHGWRIGSADFRQKYRARCIEVWRRSEIIDGQAEAKILAGQRLFTCLTFLLGLLPGKLGRFVQRLWANHIYRRQVRSFLFNVEDRRQALAEYALEQHHAWQQCGRVPVTDQHVGCDFGWRFIGHALLSRTTPRGVHRWLADSDYRRTLFERILLLCVSARFQDAYGRHLIGGRIDHWRQQERLTAKETSLLQHQLAADDLRDYVRCFGLHLGIKLSLPLLAPIKIGSVAAFLATGNPLYLLTLGILPACRVAISLWQILIRRRPALDHLDALLIGALPVVGSMAYPVQMYKKCPELAAFLLRDSASRAGCLLPIYGGQNSRTEIWAIKLTNLAFEALEIALTITTPIRHWLSSIIPATAQAPASVATSTRWDAQVDQHLAQLRETEAEEQEYGTQFATTSATRTQQRAA